MIPDETIDLYKEYYHGVYVLLHFKMQYNFDRMEYQVDVEADVDEEEIEDRILDHERECPWRMDFEGNN